MKLLLILAGIYLFFRVFGKYFMPFIMKWFMGYLGKKAQENMQARGFDTSGFQNPNEEPVSGNEKVTVQKKNNQSTANKSMDGVGDYVDFEEIE